MLQVVGSGVSVLVWSVSVLSVVALGWLLLSSLHERTKAKLVAVSVLAVFIGVGYVWLHNTGVMGDLWNQTIPAALLVVLAVWFVANVIRRKGMGGSAN